LRKLSSEFNALPPSALILGTDPLDFCPYLDDLNLEDPTMDGFTLAQLGFPPLLSLEVSITPQVNSNNNSTFPFPSSLLHTPHLPPIFQASNAC
jgi:hypothetical protein